MSSRLSLQASTTVWEGWALLDSAWEVSSLPSTQNWPGRWKLSSSTKTPSSVSRARGLGRISSVISHRGLHPPRSFFSSFNHLKLTSLESPLSSAKDCCKD